MATNELYEITLDASLFGQQVSNVYFYRETSTFPAGLQAQRAQAMASAFVQQHVPEIVLLATPDLQFQAVRCRSLFDDGQKHQILLTDVGAQGGNGGETLPAFNALSFSLTGDNPAVKPGKKRYAGINESFVIDGIVQAVGPTLALLNDIRDAIAATLRDTSLQTIVWGAPVVVKRVRSGTPGNYTYRLPENAGEAVYSNVTGVEFALDITSQVSRRKGNGS